MKQRGTIARMMTAFIAGLRTVLHPKKHSPSSTPRSTPATPSYQHPRKHKRTGTTRTPLARRKHRNRAQRKARRLMQQSQHRKHGKI